MKKILLFTFLFTNVLSYSQTDPTFDWVKVDGDNVSLNGSITIDKTIGETFSFEVQVSNNGDDAPAQYNNITFSFPSFTSSSDKYNVSNASGTSNDMEYDEYFGNETSGGDGYANYVVVEAVDDNGWDGDDGLGDEENNFEVDIDIEEYGTFDIYFRAAMSNQSSWTSGWTYEPTSGYTGPLDFKNYRVRVYIPAPKDYWISSEALSQTTIEVGESFTASCRQYSTGAEEDDCNVEMGYYLSSNNSFGSSDILLGTDVSSIGDDSYDPEDDSNLAIPQGTSSGTKYILFVADHEDEYNEIDENNNVEYIQITVTTLPDLVVQNQSVSPTTIQANTSFSTSCNIINQGTGSANNSNLKYYLSQNTIYEPAYDFYLGWDPVPNVGSLSAGSSSSETASLDMPDWAEGTYYILFVADADNDEPNESNENNNVAYVQINVTPPPCPDLIVSNIWYAPSAPYAGEDVDLYIEIKNVGDETATNTITVEYYIDGDYVGSDNITDNLSVNETNEEYYNNYQFPTEGEYLFEVVILNYTDECSTTNNIAQTTVHINPPPQPDLVVLNENVTPAIVEAGVTFSVSCDVYNQGNASANHTKIKYYLSENTTYELGSDTYLGWDPVPNVGGLDAGETSSETANLEMPEWAQGNYYVIFYADADNDETNESNETNNFAYQPVSAVQTGNLEITCQNIDGLTSPYPENNATVILYNNNDNAVESASTDALGVASFADIDVGTNYWCEIFHNQGTTIWGEEFWGKKELIDIEHNQTSSEIFTRYLPYIESVEVYNGGINVTGEAIAPNTPLIIELTVKNDGAAINAKSALKIDRDQAGSFDFEDISDFSSISYQNTHTYTFSYTPTENGDYFFNAAAYVNWSGSDRLTDGSDWSVIPIFTVQTFTVQFNIIDSQVDDSYYGGDIYTIIYDNLTDWNIEWTDVSVENVMPVWSNATPGIHPWELYNQGTSFDDEFWGGGQININANETHDLARNAPFETAITHYAFDDYTNAVNLNYNGGNGLYDLYHLAGAGQTVYIPVEVKNMGMELPVRVSVYVNENQQYTTGVLPAQTAIMSTSDTQVFVFSYTVPETLEDSTILYSNILIEGDYGNGYIVTDCENLWKEFRVTTALPKITETWPEDNLENVPISAGVEFYFNMDMDSTTVVDPANFILTDGGSTVSGTMIYYPDFDYAYFQPDAELEYNTTYTVTFKANMQNLADLYLDGNDNDVQDYSPEDDYTFSFETMENISEVRLEVPYYNQGSSNWCWATSLSMILKYYGFDRKFWEIAADFNKDINSGANGITNILLSDYLETYYSNDYDNAWYCGVNINNNTLLINRIKNSINNNNPVWLSVIGLPGHVIVVNGYNQDGFYVHDPSGAFTGSETVYHYLTNSAFIDTIDNGLYRYIIYAKANKLDSNSSNYTIQSYTSDAVRAINQFGNTTNYSALVMDGDEGHNLGYFYQSTYAGFNTTNNGIEKQFTQADVLSIEAYITSHSSNNSSQVRLILDIENLSNSTTFSPIYSDWFYIDDIGTPETDLMYSNLPSIELCDYTLGNYLANISLENFNNIIEDQFTLYFEIAPSDYASFNVTVLPNNHQDIIFGDEGIWQIEIQNSGSQSDQFELDVVNGAFYYQGNPISITPLIDAGETITVDYIMPTLSMSVGDFGAELILIQSNNDPYKNNEYSMSYEIIDCTNPIANFNIPTDICSGETVNLTDLSLDVHPNATYEWDIDEDGTPDYTDVGDISHTFNTTGTYNVNLTINQNIGCSGTQTQTINVHEVIADAGNDIEVCEGEQITLSANGGDFYTWDNGITQNIPFTAASSQTYNVTVSDNYGCSGTDQIDVTVNPVPVITSTPSITNSSCGGNDGSITGLIASGTGLSYEWQDIQQIIVGTNPDLNSVSAGSYTIFIENSDNCSISEQYTVNNVGAPNPPTASSLSPYCEGDNISPLEASGSGGTLTWYSDASLSNVLGTGSQLILSPAPTNTTNFYVTEDGACESAPTIVTVTINPLPLVDLGNDLSLCEGENTVINPGYFNSYLWSTGSTDQNITVNSTGDYWIEVSDYNGCSNSDTVNVIFNSLPFTNLGNDTAVCGNVILDAGVFSSYNWSDGNNTQTNNITSTGYYWVEVTENGCNNSDTIFVTVNDIPSLFIGNDTLIYTTDYIELNAGSEFVDYLWSNGSTDSLITVYGSIGVGTYDYNVLVTDNNGCATSDTIVITIEVATIISEITENIEIKIYPNPAKEVINLEIDGLLNKELQVDLLNVNGQVIYSNNYENKEDRFNTVIDVSNLAKGIYFVRLKNENVSKTRKIIVK